ncbi:MAG: diaminopimelate decarboxylase [Alphaproteobacteria bacterium]|nr:diaminopimelate decarboxylase [Alphaproteobacteria bacterium]
MKTQKKDRVGLWTKLKGYSINGKGHLALRGVDLVDLAGLSDRPLYIFDELALRENLQLYKNALKLFYPKSTSIFYASKAFLNLAMGLLLKQEEVGIDVCSEGELFIAQKARILPQDIIMHGNNKSERELTAAVKYGIKRIVVDNFDELVLLEKISSELKRGCGVLLRINPEIEVETHKYIATAIKESKFGFYRDQSRIPEYIQKVCASGYIKFKGIHFHLGSNIHKASFYEEAIDKVGEYLAFLKDKGFCVEELNIGGGLGIAYEDHDPVPDIHHFVKVLCEKLILTCKKKNIDLPHLMLEPGRSIVGQAGCTLYNIGTIKEGGGELHYAAVNGGMTDNLRAALYQAKYTGVLANKMISSETKRPYKIVGKCCETGDVLIENICLPPCAAGDVFVVFSTGAYTHSLASNYNKHPLPGVVFVREGAYDYVSREQSLEDLISFDRIPPHLLDKSAPLLDKYE